MTTMVLDRAVLPDPLLSLIASPRVAVTQHRDNGKITLEPIIDPDDYDSDADYLAAIPGMMDSIMTAVYEPKYERVSREELWDDV